MKIFIYTIGIINSVGFIVLVRSFAKTLKNSNKLFKELIDYLYSVNDKEALIKLGIEKHPYYGNYVYDRSAITYLKKKLLKIKNPDTRYKQLLDSIEKCRKKFYITFPFMIISFGLSFEFIRYIISNF